MEQITIDSNSLYEYLRDTISLCNTTLINGTTDSQKIAQDLLSRLQMRTNMLVTLGLPEEREFWKRIQKLL